MDSLPVLVKRMGLPSKELPESALDALIVRERTRIVAPLTEWRTLSVALNQEGLIRAPGAGAPYAEKAYEEPRPTRSWGRSTLRWGGRIAASAALVGAGFVGGRAATIGNGIVTVVQNAINDSTESSGSSVRVATKPYRSQEEARNALTKSQSEYQRASAFLAASDTSPHIVLDPSVYRGRLAALDEMGSTARDALRASPDDPLLSQYYLSTISAREATLQQLGHALPAGAKMVRF